MCRAIPKYTGYNKNLMLANKAVQVETAAPVWADTFVPLIPLYTGVNFLIVKHEVARWSDGVLVKFKDLNLNQSCLRLGVPAIKSKTFLLWSVPVVIIVVLITHQEINSSRKTPGFLT